ncbi:VOC family protein [Nocardia panacis]|uniref:VOC family protein n=1 Tax=Nocardia panacis TaxID=2340916 RepID=A0A3A4KBS0_9NOCA|nr:VOC family protein [Nocardia panacis]RJO72573.1 VOC family protein [Nocardia panacis]
MTDDIGHLHHVGHVVGDMSAALALYQRLGFAMRPPTYPALPPHEGAAPEPFGVANTHADFARNFIELVTYVREGEAHRIPSEAIVVPLQAPAEALPSLRQKIAATSATVAACLDRFEGLHILMFAASEIDTAATRLSRVGVRHGGVNSVQRPVETDTGRSVELVRYLEIDGAAPGVVAEGRVGVVANLDRTIQHTRVLSHPNGAIDLIEVLICAAAADLPAVQARYTDYLGRPPRIDGPRHIFDLDHARLILVADSDLAALLPGEHAGPLPALVACTVAVRDLPTTREHLQRNGFKVQTTRSGDPFVPAAAALGAAIIFRETAT